ncbi:MAG: hypothetical protein PHC62_08760 [Candidatus Izemoplasmatales bacterium]|nr:hypothetical protein [Candidatus Izemoplasmatales bacterium]
MAVINFLKSLVMPSRMVKYRYISVLISVCIFILSSYLLALPAKYYITNNLDRMINEDNYMSLQAIKNIPYEPAVNAVIEEIESKECHADMNEDGGFVLTCDNLKVEDTNGALVDTNFYENDIVYVNDENITIKIHFVIDLYDTIEGEASYSPSEKFTYTEEAFPDLETTEYYLIILWPGSLYYQAHPYEIANASITRNDKIITESYTNASFSTIGFDTKNLGGNGTVAGAYLVQQISTGYIPNYTNSYSLLTFFFCVIFPLILVFLFWIFFRKTGRLKAFKEYYNIAALASIVPTLVTFVAIWFAPGIISNLYLFGFSAYYLIILYRINNSANFA